MIMDLKFRLSIRSIAYDTFVITCLCTSCFYFSFVAINGNHGVKRKAELSFENLEKSERLVALKKKAFGMEQKTKRLQDDSLDLDLLDEQARKILGLIRLDELIIVE